MKHWFGLMIFLCLVQPAFSQDWAFTPNGGGGIAQLNFQYVKYDRVQLQGGDTSRSGRLLRDISDFTASIYAEYALGDPFVIFASFPIKYVSSATAVNPFADYNDTLPSGNKLALGNIDLGVKYKFYDKKLTVSASLRGELRTGNYDEKTGLSTGYQAWGIVPMLHIGKFWQQKFFVNLNAGGSYRTDGYSGDFRVQAMGGIKIKKIIWVKANIDFRKSFQNGYYESEPNSQTSLYVNNQEWLGVEGILGYESKIGFGVQVALRGNFLGNNIPTSAYFSGGLYYRWKNPYPGGE